MILYKVMVSLTASGWEEKIIEKQAAEKSRVYVIESDLGIRHIKKKEVGKIYLSVEGVSAFSYRVWCIDNPCEYIPQMRGRIIRVATEYKQSIDNLFKHIPNEPPQEP